MHITESSPRIYYRNWHHSNSPQKSGAGNSDFIVLTWVTPRIQLSYFRCPCCLIIDLHPSSLTPQTTEIFWLILMSTLFAFDQYPSQMCRQPLSPIMFHPDLRSNNLAKFNPILPRTPWRDAWTPSHQSYFHLHTLHFTQNDFFEAPPVRSTEELTSRVLHLVPASFSTKVPRLMT